MKMKFLVVIICAAAAMVSPITVSSNGNSPKIKMVGGMMVDVDEPNPAPLKPVKETNSRIKGDPQKFLKLNDNSTKLSINERYRRLIPYMTFYYANDLATPITDVPKSFEVEKAEIVQTHTLEQSRREPKKIYYSINRNIPRYEGNRLTEHNIASANPIKYFYKDAPVYQNLKITPAYNPLLNGQDINGEFGKYIQKPLIKSPSVPFSAPTRKPYLNLYENDNSPNVRYYVSDEKEQAPKYKLVPYEQTPPVKFVPQNVNFYNTHKKTPVFPIDESFSNSPKIQNFYENPQRIVPVRKQPFTISESYYEKSRPQAVIGEPVVEGGFKPIVNVEYTTKTPLYDLRTPLPHFESEKHHSVKIIETISEKPSNTDYKPNYYQYVTETPSYTPEPTYVSPNSLTLTDLIRTLQLNKSIPEAITRENVGSSIRTLLQVLNALRAVPQHNEVDTPILSTPTPFVATKPIEVSVKPVVHTTLAPIDTDIQGEHHLADINTPSQHLDDYSPNMGTSQQFPPPVNSDDEGGTPGKPGVDYPILTIIPPTKFNCKTQRYKGFFADPETRCQVWHYCDLNGGQASFLCPNGTIFSQAALTCDWWFNVKCASTTQLYVLNESLYKYILPHSPKFPEDYSGPLVDKYLTLKFKEMEEQFKKNKNRQSAAEKIDSGEAFDKMDSDVEKEDTDSTEKAVESDVGSVSEPSVIVELPGTSGNVARLDD